MLFLPLLSIAQLIDNTNGKVFTDKPYFNQEEIRKRGIRSISGIELHYKLGDKPRNTNLFKKYIFNEKGQLVERLESVELTKKEDTLFTYFDYDEDNNLVAMRQRDAFGNYAYLYKYDDEGRLIYEEYRRSLTASVSTSPDYLISEKYKVSSKSMEYNTFDDHEVMTISNDGGDPYKDITTYFNKEGLISKKVERLRRMPGAKTSNYYYDKHNNLDSLTIRSNISGFQNRSFVYAYDDLGNLLKKEVFKNGEYITQYQVLYDEDALLIDDVLVQQISTQFIKVLELRNYSYFNSYGYNRR